MVNKLISSLFLTITLLLTACGGGSSDDAKPEPIPTPVITSFTPSLMEITEGEEVKLTADFSHGQGTIDVGVGTINSGDYKTVKPNTTTTYTLTVENSTGVKVSASITIEIVRLKIVSITNPSDESTVHDDTYVSVNVIANDRLAKVTAEIEGNIATLNSYSGTAGSDEKRVSGYLSLTGLTDGDYLLTITARDSLARTTSVQKQVTIDNLPIIKINQPSHLGFANPLLPLDISCTETSGDCQIIVKNQDTVLATATNQLNETIDLSDFIGEQVILTIEGKNNSNQLATSAIITYVNESDVSMTLVKEFSDNIIDFDGKRALLHNDVPSAAKQLQIANTMNDDVTIIEFNNDHKIYSDKSILTSTGAIFSASTGSTYDWNNNELINLGQVSNVRVAGDFAAYCDSNNLLLRTLSEQSNTILATGCGLSDVSANGTVVGSKGWNVVRYKNQEETLLDLAAADSSDLDAGGARINGSLIVYFQSNISRSRRVILYDDNDDKIIFTGNWHYAFGGAYTGYAINNGWLAYSNTINLYTRDTSGNILQRTDLKETSYIRHLADNGELMLINDGKRYLSKSSGDLLLVGSSDIGTSVYRNGAWYIIIEESVYKLTTD